MIFFFFLNECIYTELMEDETGAGMLFLTMFTNIDGISFCCLHPILLFCYRVSSIMYLP